MSVSSIVPEKSRGNKKCDEKELEEERHILSKTARSCQYLINSAFLSFFWGCQKGPKLLYLRLLLVASLLSLGYDATPSSNKPISLSDQSINPNIIVTMPFGCGFVETQEPA